jgi:type I restriction-modification system DNA methylase subunit
MPYLFCRNRRLEACVSHDAEQKNLINKIRSLGEERFAEIMDELLANDKVSSTVAKALSRTQKYKAQLDKNVSFALSLVNQPTREDYDKLRKQVRHLQRELEELQEKIDPILKAAAKRKAHKADEPAEQ